MKLIGVNNRFSVDTRLLFVTVFCSLLFLNLSADARGETCPINKQAGEYASAMDDSEGNQRFFLYKLPNGYNPDDPQVYPIIFAFHGGGQSALKFAEKAGQLRMRELANERQFILVYPQGNSVPIEDPPGCPPAVSYFLPAVWEGITLRMNSPDVLFVEELYSYLSNELKIDDSKVYAVGFSNGGMLAQRLGGERSDRFTAIAAVASTVGAKLHITANGDFGSIDYWTVPVVPPAPERKPVPILTINSVLDPIIPFDGGATISEGEDFLSRDENWEHWYRANDCDFVFIGTSSITTSTGATGVEMSNLCKSNYFTSPLVSIVFDDLGAAGGIDDHRWPDTDTDGYDASEVIVDFLLTFSK